MDERFLFNYGYTTLRELDEKLFLYPTKMLTPKGWLYEAHIVDDNGKPTSRSWCLTHETYKQLQGSVISVVDDGE